MKNNGSLTALMSAFGRVYHAENDQPVIFNDALSRGLLTPEEYQQLQAYLLSGIDFFAPGKKEAFAGDGDMLKWIVQTQIAPTPLARARFCEDALKTAVQTGTRQYVLLGAGMDTFAFRNTQLQNTLRIFEVDHPLTQADKRQRIARAGWDVPENLTFVPMDFTTDDLAESLLSQGFQKDVKTFFGWLGVSYYLTKEQIDHTIAAIGSISAEGSSLVFDYATHALFGSPVRRVQNMLAMAAAGGEPMQSAFDYRELERMLEQHRFLIYEHLTPDDIQQRYFSGRTDDLTAFEHIEYVLSVWK